MSHDGGCTVRPRGRKIERVAIPNVGAEDARAGLRRADLRNGLQASDTLPRQSHQLRAFGRRISLHCGEAGDAVRDRFQPGMRVVARCVTDVLSAGRQVNLCENLVFNNGAYADITRFSRILRENLMEIPPHLSFTDAALVEPSPACCEESKKPESVRRHDRGDRLWPDRSSIHPRFLSGRGVRVIAVGKRSSQIKAAEALARPLAFDVPAMNNPVAAVRQVTHRQYGADSVIEAVGSPDDLAMGRCRW